MRIAASLCLPLLLVMMPSVASAEDMTYDLRIEGDPAARVRLQVTGEGEVVRVVRVVTRPSGPSGPSGESRLEGAGARRGDRITATLAGARGLSGALQLGQASGPGIAAEWTIGDGAIRGRAGAEVEVGAATPLPPFAYTSAPPARDGDGAIDLARENAAASARLRTLSQAERAARWPVVICPGIATDDQTEPLHRRATRRLRLAVDAMRQTGAQVILVSGGNVHPEGTPHNEALEMKRALLALGVAEDRIAIDPAARHTTTNLRNAGRFLFAHGLSRALIVSTTGQSFYVGHAAASTFHLRCERTLGYRVGQLRPIGLRRTEFTPGRRCLTRGDDPLDP